MRENNNVIGWAMLMTTFIYSALINASLFFSMFMGLGLTLIAVNNALKDHYIPPDLFNKTKEIFLFGLGIFVVLTTIFYSIIAKF
jgi:hypothetical protein